MGLEAWNDLDVRDLAIMHKGARRMLIEQKLEHLYHLRLAQAEGNYYADEIRRLEGELWKFDVKEPHKQITPLEAAKNRRELAVAMGLKMKKK